MTVPVPVLPIDFQPTTIRWPLPVAGIVQGDGNAWLPVWTFGQEVTFTRLICAGATLEKQTAAAKVKTALRTHTILSSADVGPDLEIAGIPTRHAPAMTLPITCSPEFAFKVSSFFTCGNVVFR